MKVFEIIAASLTLLGLALIIIGIAIALNGGARFVVTIGIFVGAVGGLGLVCYMAISALKGR